MTAPASSGGPSPLRIGGIALLGIGVIAGIVGLAMLATNGGGNGGQTAAPPPSTQATDTAGPSPSAFVPPPPTDTTPTGSVPVPVPSFGPTPTNGIAGPSGTGSGAPPQSPNGGAGSKDGGAGSGGAGSGTLRAPVRVYNNSTITGLAARAAADFRSAGWQVEEVGNYPYGIIPTSTVYYRPGTGEQQAAQAIGDQFSLKVEPRFEGLDEASPGLIVIATNDYRGRSRR
ncbi:LytR C-terminal domain-containing protein [Pseudonocardia sp.]|uniref:LytR C-terminal domain-containing protein n=1 Tax=Pseudonocardia sp. TaxID=60912 RepID=UPI002D849D44|nr:LytR C-terminal domain-containing protein [Pseudonocardia sp.]